MKDKKDDVFTKIIVLALILLATYFFFYMPEDIPAPSPAAVNAVGEAFKGIKGVVGK